MEGGDAYRLFGLLCDAREWVPIYSWEGTMSGTLIGVRLPLMDIRCT